MGHIHNAGALLFDRDFAVKIACHPCEFADHRLDLQDAAAFFFDVKALEAHK
jgi:hypothetical protein